MQTLQHSRLFWELSQVNPAFSISIPAGSLLKQSQSGLVLVSSLNLLPEVELPLGFFFGFFFLKPTQLALKNKSD